MADPEGGPCGLLSRPSHLVHRTRDRYPQENPQELSTTVEPTVWIPKPKRRPARGPPPQLALASGSLWTVGTAHQCPLRGPKSPGRPETHILSGEYRDDINRHLQLAADRLTFPLIVPLR